MPISPVSVTVVVPRPFAAVTTRMPVADVPRRFGEFLDLVYASGRAGEVALDGQNIFVYRPTDNPDIVDVEFGVGVTAPFTGSGKVGPATVPACVAATATLYGDYSQIRSTHQAIIDWCRTNGRRRTGTRWEVYGHWSDDPARVRTDVFHQLEP
jgi:hypothetical protein